MKKLRNISLLDFGGKINGDELAILIEPDSSTLSKIQIAIKAKDLKQAHTHFINEILKPDAIERWRRNTMFVLKRYQKQYLFENLPIFKSINR